MAGKTPERQTKLACYKFKERKISARGENSAKCSLKNSKQEDGKIRKLYLPNVCGEVFGFDSGFLGDLSLERRVCNPRGNPWSCRQETEAFVWRPPYPLHFPTL